MLFERWEHGWEKEYSFCELGRIGITAGFRIIEIDGYGFTIEDFVRNGARKINNKFFNRYIMRPILYIPHNMFFLFGTLLGKALRKCFCKNLVAVFEK